MYQKDFIRNLWKSAGLYDENDSQLQQFLKSLDDPNQCWKEMTNVCRRNFAPYKAKLAQPILDSDDKLVHLNLIRIASETNDDEMVLIERYVDSSDPKRDQVELRAVALRNIPRLTDALRKKPNLTHEVRKTIASLAAAATPPLPSTAPAQPQPDDAKS